MAKHYSAEFKLESVKRVDASEAFVASVAKELGVNVNTLHGWLKAMAPENYQRATLYG